jgi:hypothetical protein
VVTSLLPVATTMMSAHRHDLAAFQHGLRAHGEAADAAAVELAFGPSRAAALSWNPARTRDGTLHPGNSCRES